ncbi:restriction endonuclease subunit S [Pseudomonas sp. EA_105y_Pfl2_R69]|uniref:restriction endonuclease subunit S n=1 Tax=Pseudomonas sp. EA_105y_Pfl2_R69 TaxID=3088683 RepID=UPI0030DAE2BC
MSKPKATNRKENAQITLAPKLRFPEFRDSKEWTKIQLKVIADPVLDRASLDEKNSTLSLSAEQGTVLKGELFGSKEANENSERYLKVIRDDFIYNDRATKISTYGTIKRLSKHSDGVVAPIYKCFRFHAEENPAFWEWYFESGAHNAQVSSLVNGGARAGRFNISISQFLSTSVWHPRESEQQKIADCLESVEELIAAQTLKVSALKTHKKGLILQLFPRKGDTQPCLRLPEFRNAGEWKENLLVNVLRITSGKRFKASEYSNTGIRLMQAENIGYDATKWSENTIYLPESYADKYSELVLRDNDIVLALYGPVSNDELKISKVRKDDALSILSQRLVKLEAISNSLCVDFALQFCRYFIKGYAASISIGIGQPMISLKELHALSIPLPSLLEQRRIADCLTSIDSLIISHTQKLETIKMHKEGLMQLLFPSPNEVNA